MGRGEISWKRRSGEGERYQLYARQVGEQWRFYVRQRRFDNWEVLEHPLLEDWLTLLEGVRRRVARHRIRPEEIDRLIEKIRSEFPGQEIEME